MLSTKGITTQLFSVGRVLTLLLFLLLSPVLSAAEIFVLPDRNPVGMGEDFTLTFSTSEQPDGHPDFSPLSKDFDILGTTTSNNVRMINGVVTSESSWLVRLYPKTSGTLQIPAIQFGSQSSQPSQITVDENAATDGLPRDGVIVELETETPEPYVQQQFIVVQRLLHSVDLRRGSASMSHPEVNEGNAQVQQLGKTVNRTLNRKGIQYKVFERRYAVFPKSSGKLTFRPTVFQGVISAPGVKRRQLPFGMMSGRQIRRFSEPLTLDIKARPKGAKGAWLPAKSVSLNMHWETQPEQFKTGEPVTLTIAVIADGLMAEQLPEIKLDLPKGLKGYSNQPELRNDYQGSSLIGTRQERWILIGTAPGEYTLPALSLKWWNIEAGEAESAFIEAKTITVTGEVSAAPVTDGGAQEIAELTQSEQTDTADSATTEELLDATDAQTTDEKPVQESTYWFWLFVIGVLLLILLGILYKRKLNGKSDIIGPKPAVPKVNYHDVLERACKRNDAQGTYDALLGWVRDDLQLTPPVLAQLRQEVDMPLRQQIDELSMVLYAKKAGEWEGAEMWQAIQDFFSHRNQGVLNNKASDDLVDLYPD